MYRYLNNERRLYCLKLRNQSRFYEKKTIFLHYAMGRPVGFGCGHPDWGWEVDRSYELEGRVRWPKAGHTEVTNRFHREVFNSPNLLGVFAGHVHRQTMDQINGIPQFVTATKCQGGRYGVGFFTYDR